MGGAAYRVGAEFRPDGAITDLDLADQVQGRGQCGLAFFPLGWADLARVSSDVLGRLDLAQQLGSITTYTAVVGFAYFYKRRSMFGATWRWRGLERWLPGWAPSESTAPVVRRGYAGLSPVRRRAFIAATVIMTAIVVFGK